MRLTLDRRFFILIFYFAGMFAVITHFVSLAAAPAAPAGPFWAPPWEQANCKTTGSIYLCPEIMHNNP